MATNNDLVLNVGSITGLGMREINGDDVNPYARPGTIAIIVDAFGPRILKYCRNVNGSAITMGELHAYAAGAANVRTTSVANITSGTTTSAVTTGLTANRHDGMICYVLDNNDSAGAAPEGEASIVADNTTTAITLEADYPYSVALAANDDLMLVSNYQVEDAAAGDEAWTVAGVALGRYGVANLNYGWYQVEGIVNADATAATITSGDPVSAGAVAVAAFGTDGHELWIGTALAGMTSDSTAATALVNLKLFAPENSGGTP